MKKILFSTLILVACQAQGQWNYVPVRTNSGHEVGHIFHTESVGRQGENRIRSGIRMVCSQPGYTNQGWRDPIIGFFWSGVDFRGTVNPRIKIDDIPVDMGDNFWFQDHRLTFRPVANSLNLIELMLTGQRLEVEVNIGGVEYRSLFMLNGFKSGYSEFIGKCR